MVIRAGDAGGPIHYADFGGSGPAMVMVHGLGGSHLNWMAVAPALARGYRVLAPDLIGFGYTPPAGRHATVQQNLRALERFVIEVVGEPVILVGNSMGGLLSARLAARRPAWVRSLVLVDPACPNPRFVGVSAIVVAFFGALLTPGLGEAYLKMRSRRMGVEAVVDQTLAAVYADTRRIDPEVRRAHLELHRERVETMPWVDSALVEAARTLLASLVQRKRFFEMLDEIEAPTLLIEGEEDRLVPLGAVEQIADHRRDWTFRVLAGVGHVPMMEAPDQFLEILEGWLDRAEAAKAG